MAERPIRVDVSMSAGSEQVMFTEVFADGYRTAYWKPFWSACWHAFRLILRGVEVRDRIDA